MTRRYSQCRNIHDKVAELLREGWVGWWSGAAHFRLQHPNGFTTTVPMHVGDWRIEKNWFSQLRHGERNGWRSVRAA